MFNKFNKLSILMILPLLIISFQANADDVSNNIDSDLTAKMNKIGSPEYEMSPQEIEDSLKRLENGEKENKADSTIGVLNINGRDVIQDYVNEDAESFDINQGRRARSENPRNELWVDVYQESPVTLKYIRSGESYRRIKDIPEQTVPMSFAVVTLIENGVKKFVRAHLVSPGAEGHRSSVGTFDIDRRHRYYTSNTYGSRMDFAQFFIGGIALHQTDTGAYSALGGPASHGCIRHHKLDANAMWNIIGEAIEKEYTVNIKVNNFGAAIASYTPQDLLTKSLNRSIVCTRYAPRLEGAGADNSYCSSGTSLHEYDSNDFPKLFN